MKRLIIILLAVVLAASVVFAGEREELTWKGKALIADYQLKQQAFGQAQQELQLFLKELDEKGLIFKDGIVVEKPKPKPEPKKPETK
jgi:hypothetical protein